MGCGILSPRSTYTVRGSRFQDGEHTRGDFRLSPTALVQQREHLQAVFSFAVHSGAGTSPVEFLCWQSGGERLKGLLIPLKFPGCSIFERLSWCERISAYVCDSSYSSRSPSPDPPQVFQEGGCPQKAGVKETRDHLELLRLLCSEFTPAARDISELLG